MPRADPATPKKPKSPASSPKKAKTTSPGIQKLRKDHGPFNLDSGIRGGTRTVTKTDAMKNFSLNDDDIGSLPYEVQRRQMRVAVNLYDCAQLTDLANRKYAKLGRPLAVAGSHSGSSGLAAWQNHILNPDPPPLKIQDYTCPPTALKPDPEKIYWAPSHISGPVTVEDACRLYCIVPEDIQDLAQHSSWIDLSTVAKRAVTLHGGFYAHKELVLERRREEEDMLTQEFPDEAEKRQSHFRFSPIILQQLQHTYNDLDAMSATTPPQDPVAVLYPIKYCSRNNSGCIWNWEPDWGDF
ncbi:hypothetical protein DFH09DRAFT_1187816 [Mycena vulgaris]|nr:hypothetical protein DFH09DRAFT_1187816 [Mycena vulgaris]